jgi:hypothetical protein
MIDKPKKERRFLKALGRVGEILIQEVLLKVGSNLIKRIGGKKTLPSILFLFLSISLFAQYPNTGNKQRLGYQTTGDGLVYRGIASDTVGIKSSGLNNAYFILDTVNNILYNYIKTKGGWKFSNGDTVIINNTIDTTSLSNRINLKVNISDTTNMLLPYLRKADTASMLTPYFRDSDTTSLNLTSRFATKLNISDTASMLTNYLRSGVAASTYLTQSSAASTYLPLTGGTMTGTINRQEGSNDGSTSTFYYNILNYFAKRDNNKGNQTAQITFTDRPGTSTFPNNVRTSDIYLMTAKNFSGGQLGQYLDTTISVVANQDGGRIGISKLNPAYKLDVNGTFNASGNSLIGGTLGVTGETTLSNLAGSGTRMVTASSTGLLSTQTILSPTTRGSNTFILPDIGAISFLRYNADNTVSQRAADGMRSDLGGTTIGQSMFTLTNPSAITFLRFNADNTVTALDAASFRTAIGAGTGNGNGTVTSVTGTLPISSSGGTTPNITIANAGVSTTGVVTASTQTFGGAKTFNGDINGSSALNMTGFSTLTGGASIGTLATTSTLTRVLGINASNAIGELSLGTGMSVGSGVLSVQAAGASQTGLVTSFTQTFGGNKTFNGTVTLASASGTAASVIGRSSTGQVVDLALGSGLSLLGGTLNISQQNFNGYLASTSTSITLLSDYGLVEQLYLNINQGSTVSITLPTANLNSGMAITIKNRGTGAVNSNANNIEPLNSSSLDAIILLSGGGKFTTLVSDGTNWIKMTGN